MKLYWCVPPSRKAGGTHGSAHFLVSVGYVYDGMYNTVQDNLYADHMVAMLPEVILADVSQAVADPEVDKRMRS